MNKYLIILLSLLFPCMLLAQNKGIRVINNKGTIIYVDPSKWYQVGTNLFNKNTNGNVAIGVDTLNTALVNSRLYISNNNSTSLPVLKLDKPFDGELTDNVLTWDPADFSIRKIDINKLSPNDWHLLGNTGTDPAINFVGTTDNQDLSFRTNNTEKMRIASSGNIGIGTNAPAAKLEINSSTADSSGLRLTNLTSASPASAGTAIGVNAAGDVVVVNRPLTTVSNTSSLNTLTTTVNGVTGDAVPIVNSNILTAVDGKLVSTVNGVATTPPVPVLVSANNGLTSTNGNVQLGGTLTEPTTTIAASAANTLAVTGLQAGSAADRIVVADNNGVLKTIAPTPLNFWSLTGNMGTNPASNYIGTTDDQPLRFKINSTAAGLLEKTNTAFGYNAFPVTTGSSQNTAIGVGTLTVAGYYFDNTVVGYNSLSKTTASANTAIGSQVLTNFTTGPGSAPGRNTAVGFLSQASNISGSYNSSLGSSSLNQLTTGSYNVSLGSLSGQNSTTGSYNLFAGNNSGQNSTTGSYNLFAGNYSGVNNLTGSYNIFLGNYAGGAYIAANGGISGNSNIIIGGNSVPANAPALSSLTASNEMNIGNTLFGTGVNNAIAAATGKIGINTNAPANTLHVKAAADPIRAEGLQAGSTTDNVVVADGTGVLKIVNQSSLAVEPWQVQSSSDKATLNNQNIYQNGNIGIGDFSATNPLTKLDVRGSARIGSPNTGATIGGNSFASGSNLTASGFASAAFGSSNLATGIGAVSFGVSNTASGNYAVSFGENTIAPNYISLVMGRYNAITSGNSTLIDQTDALFQIGNGTIGALNNALTVLYNGNTGIGINGSLAAKPTARLDIGSGNVRIRDINTVTGSVADNLVVADPITGVLKTVPQSSLAVEPWQVQSTSNKATANTDNIYQKGYIGIGDFSGSNMLTNLDVRGSARVGVPSGGAIGANSFASGNNTTASGANSAAFGNATASGNTSFAAGFTGTTASGSYSAAFGSGSTTAGGNSSFAAGNGNKIDTNSNNSAAFGVNNNIYSTQTGFAAFPGYANFAAGNGNKIYSQNSVALGSSNTMNATTSPGSPNNAQSSVTMGYNNTTDGNSTIAMGANNSSSGIANIAMGSSNTIINGSTYSVAVGQGNVIGNSTASQSSFAAGQGNSINGNYSNGIGQSNAISTSNNSIAIGQTNTINNANNSTAIGLNTTVNANISTAIGYNVTVSAGHNGAFIFGDNSPGGTISSLAANQFSGMFNGGYRLLTDRVNTAKGMFMDNLGNVNFSGTVSSAGVLITSDMRLKKDIQNLSGVLNNIKQLRGVNYYWKDVSKGTERQLGMIAQELEKVYPELVFTNKETGFKSVNYAQFTGVLLEGIKEQQSQIEDLKLEVGGLKKQISSNGEQQNQIVTYENKIKSLEDKQLAQQKELEELKALVNTLAKK